MLTLEDCLGFSRLTAEQIEAIASHQHLDMIIAAEWAENVLDRPGGRAVVQQVLEEEADRCRNRGDFRRWRRYQTGFDEFVRGERARR